MANHRLYPFWSHLTTALRTGLPQNETKDGGPYPFLALYADPARLKEFLRAMTGESIIDDDRCENAFALLMSLNMLVETADGLD